MAVHLYGKSCEMDEIIKICKNKNLALIEDCAQSHGSFIKIKKQVHLDKWDVLAFIQQKFSER